MKPSIGRIVHFHISPGCAPQAALVTQVWSDTCVNLTVFDGAGGVRGESSVVLPAEGSTPSGKYWAWPPRA